jgi:steroid delta-isomerase-like uncharacterized protein
MLRGIFMATENVRLAHRWFEEVWNERRTDTIDELLTAESVCDSEAGPLRGPEEFKKRAYATLLSAFPDIRVTVRGTIAEGDQVVVRWAASGTHLGDGLGFPATGRSVSFQGMTWIRYKDGKMLEGEDRWNQSGLIDSLRIPDSSANDLSLFQGTWVAVAFEKEGAKTPDEHLENVRLVIDGDRYRYSEPGGGFEGRYRLDQTKDPKEIDSIPTTGEHRGRVALGSMSLRGTPAASVSRYREVKTGRPNSWRAPGRDTGSTR